MRLNKKGYMLVEIIVSFALTFAIMISMINLVLSFKNKNEDIYYEAKYLKDKNLITRNIMDDLNNAVVTEVDVITTNNNIQEFNFWIIRDYISTIGENSGKRTIKIIKNDNGTTTIKYEIPTDSKDSTKANVVNYEKTIEPSLVVGNMHYKDENGIFNIVIPVNSIYTDESYNINLVTKRVYSLDMNVFIEKNGICEPGVSVEERNNKEYCKFSKGYPSSDEGNKNVFLILDEGIEKFDIYRFLEYNSHITITGVKVVELYTPSRKFANPVEINLEKDTAINLYFDKDIRYKKLEICKGNGSNIICEIEHKN